MDLWRDFVGPFKDLQVDTGVAMGELRRFSHMVLFPKYQKNRAKRKGKVEVLKLRFCSDLDRV